MCKAWSTIRFWKIFPQELIKEHNGEWKKLKGGRNWRKNHMRLAYLVSCPSLTHEARRMNREALTSLTTEAGRGCLAGLQAA